MQSEDRVIHFSTELIHPPAQHKKADLQKLYFELSQTRAAYDSSDFASPVQYRFYSRRGPKTQSVALFFPDRMVLIEEWADIPMSTFVEKVREVATHAFAVLGIRPIMVHTATVRSTFALTHFDDARVFLLDHVCQQADRIAPHFQRPVGVGGLRFILPETPDHVGSLHITIESFRHSRNEIFVEVKGIFANQNIGPAELAQSAANIHLVRNFISNHVFPFLNQYDTAEGRIP
jgi:hypothetical protein